MTFKQYKSQLRTIQHTDPHFYINDGLIRAPRVGFHILQECPPAYKTVIEECVKNGWLKPIAHTTERELIFMGLTNE